MSHLAGSFTGLGDTPEITAAKATTGTTVRVTFSEPMRTLGLATPASYAIIAAPGSAARTVTAVAASTIGDAVTLTLDGPMTAGADNYTVRATGLADRAGNPLVPPVNEAIFNGVAVTPEIAGHCAEGLKRLASQYQPHERLKAVLCILAGRWDGPELAAAELLALRQLETAAGAQLDGIGKLVGEDRGGQTDTIYRIALRARILTNASQGDPDTLITILTLLVDGRGPVTLVEHFPNVVIMATSGIALMEGEIYALMLARAVPAAVRLILQHDQPATVFFGFDEDPAAATWAEDANSTPGEAWAEAT